MTVRLVVAVLISTSQFGSLACATHPTAVALVRGTGPGPLRVSENHRFLVQEDGTPFFWLGEELNRALETI